MLHTDLAADGGRFSIDAEGDVDAGLLCIGIAGFSNRDNVSVFEGQARADGGKPDSSILINWG